MIQTLRDAEIQIDALKRGQNELIRELRALQSKNGTSGIKTETITQVQKVIEIDSILTADQNTILHKLLHIFNQLKAEMIDVQSLEAIDLFVDTLNLKKLDIRDNSESQIHISEELTETGTYITDFHDDIFYASFFGNGVMFDGNFWIPKHTEAIILGISATNGLILFRDTGLTIDISYGPTIIFQVDATGNVILLVPLAISSGGTGANNDVDARTNLDVYSKAEVDALIPLPVTGDTRIAYATSGIALTTVDQDIPGTTLITTKTGYYAISGVFDFAGQGAGDIGSYLLGSLVINGASHAQKALKVVSTASTDRATIAQNWVGYLNAGTTLKLQAMKHAGSGTSQLYGYTSLMIQWQA